MRPRPFFWLETYGRVVNATKEGAVEPINDMAKKHTGRDVYTPVRENEVRVMYTIEPERVVAGIIPTAISQQKQ